MRGVALALASIVTLLVPSSATAATITAGELSVITGSLGSLQGTYSGGSRLFTSSSSSEFSLRFADGPFGGRSYGSAWRSISNFAQVSQSPVTRDADTQSQEMVYEARSGTADVVRVRQTTRVRDGERSFRVTYDVENRSTSALRYRALTGGDLYVGDDNGGTGVARPGPPRFVGDDSPDGIRGGAEEVLSSRLPADDLAIAVAPWSARQQGSLSAVGANLTSEAGLADGIATSYLSNTALAVQWSDHLDDGAGLQPGDHARYEVVWHVYIPTSLSLTNPSASPYVGARHTLQAALADSDGLPVGDGSLRWSVAGANSTASSEVRTDAAGRATVSYEGQRSGNDIVTVFVDADGDGVRDPEEAQRTARVYWSPRLTVEQPVWVSEAVGTPRSFRVTMRDSAGVKEPDAQIRWSVSGPNATEQSTLVRTDAGGIASITLRARRAGTDVLTVFADADGDGTQGADEHAVTRDVWWAPPPAPIVLDSWTWPTVPGPEVVDIVLRDEFGILIADGQLRWWAEGVNPRDAQTIRSSAEGRATISIAGEHSGAGTVWVHHDANANGEREDDEPLRSMSLSWSPAPPPPVTRRTLDGDGMDVTLSSVGGLQARFDPQPGIPARDLFDEYDSGLFVRFMDGPLAGQTYGTSYRERFYGEPQDEPTRTGDTVSQRSSWTVRRGDADVLRVTQVARLQDRASSVRMTWSVENLADEPVSLRVGTIGDPIVEGSSSGLPVLVGGPPRFAGIEHSTGFAAGIEEVRASRLPGEGSDVPVAAWSGAGLRSAWSLNTAMASTGGIGNIVPSASSAAGVGVEWSDHAVAGQELATGAAAAARYEAVWRLRRPAALRLSPPSDVAETRHEHRVTATLLGAGELPRNDVALRWSITGANPREGSATSTGLGQAVIAWTGRNLGRDSVTVYADLDGDGARDADEPQRTVTVDWRLETAVDPPTIAPIIRPDGSRVAVSLQGTGDQQFFGIIPSAVSSFPRCADGSPQVNATLSVNVDGAAGVVVDGSVSLLAVNPSTLDLLAPIDSILPVGAAVDGTYQFVIECLRQASLFICYELEELGLPIERFCVLLGGVGFYDPSGTVYDADRADELVAGGASMTQARRQAAISGARVVLHRGFEGAFRRVLSGDPFVTPNVNPYVTEADGRFAWNVSPGTYRVVVSADGYDTTTSRSATVPPPDLDVDVGLRRDASYEPPAQADPEDPTGDVPATEPEPDEEPSSPATEPDDESAAPAAEPETEAATSEPAPQASAPATAPAPPPSAAPAKSSQNNAQPPPSPSAAVSPAPHGYGAAPWQRITPNAAAQASASSEASASPRLRVRRKPKVNSRGVMNVRVTCVGESMCAGKLRITSSDKTSLRSVRVHVPAGSTRTIKVRISERGRSKLRRGGSQRVTVAAVIDGKKCTLGKPRARIR